MNLYATRGEDVVTSSQSVTSLAHEARRVIAGPVHESETEELIRRIDRLEQEWRGMPSAPIHAWIKNLRKQVKRS